VAQGIINCWLRFPPKREDANSAMKRLWEWSIVQAEAMSETGIVAGLLAAPLMGEVTVEDADSAVIIDMARNILGNPYDTEAAAPALGPGDADDVDDADDAGDAGADGAGATADERPGDGPVDSVGGWAPDGSANAGSARVKESGTPSDGIIDVDATERAVPAQPSEESSGDGSR
jgi:hypothetical protein